MTNGPWIDPNTNIEAILHQRILDRLERYLAKHMSLEDLYELKGWLSAVRGAKPNQQNIELIDSILHLILNYDENRLSEGDLWYELVSIHHRNFRSEYSF